MLEGLRFVPADGFNYWNHAHLETSYLTIEALLVRGADPNLTAGPCRTKETPLRVIIVALHCQIEAYERVRAWRDDEEYESVYRMLMRIIDLLLRHGADDPRPDLYRCYAYEQRSNVDYGPWILQRADCTPLLRQHVLRPRGSA